MGRFSNPFKAAKKVVKTVTKPIAKVLDKVVPNELKPYLPYLAAVAPILGPQMGILSNLTKLQAAGLYGGGALAAQLSQEGSEGDFDVLPIALAAGSGYFAQPKPGGGPSGIESLKLNVPGGEGTMGYPELTFGEKAQNLGIKALQGTEKFFQQGQGAEGFLGTTKALATAVSPAVTGQIGQDAYNFAKQAEEDYLAELDAFNALAGEQREASDEARRSAIIASMTRADFTQDIIDETLDQLGLKDGGRVGYQTGGITEGGSTSLASLQRQGYKPSDARATLEDYTNALRSVSAGTTYQQQRQAKDYARNQASQMLNEAMKSADPNKGPGLQGIYDTFFKNKLGTNFQRTFTKGGDGRMFGYASLDRDKMLDQMANQMLNTTQYSQPKIDQRREKEFADYMNNLISSTYGKADDYKAEAMTLGMPTEAYFDYLVTSDPKDVMTSYDTLSRDPYFDPKTYVATDYSNPETPRPPSPYGVYFQGELQRQIDAGIPEAQRIQQGQVMGLPTVLTGGAPGSQMGPGYESYDDALARTRQMLGLKNGGIASFKDGGIMDLGGKEMDMRTGGFIPIGAKERADDVPARLSKNEFVMTADAVRAAGGGSVNKGAKRMYNLMHNLEARA